MQSRLASPLAALAPGLRAALSPLLANSGFEGVFSASEATKMCAASGLDIDGLCLALLPLAAACAQAGVSHFPVGAIVQGESGNLYFGANMEFAGVALSQTVHAEQSAITHAWLRGERRLTRITVNYTPCGHCRQFMHELNSGADLIIQLPGRSPTPLGHYLPDAFGPRDLGIEGLLMDKVCHGYRLTRVEAAADLTPSGAGPAMPSLHAGPTTPPWDAPPAESLPADAPLCLQALQAANQSHAPYSQAHCGVALQMADGRIFAGRYAENAAFNPSLPPLQAALILMNMAGGASREIRRAILAERDDAPISLWDATRATLRALGCRQIYRGILAQ
ncbi:cytidine deaminase [Martelella alba]|uniref:Cytidine deaminase n=1 Tax=Martelella alba TaxID=2590451 RepID=A0ABY2SL02_9HYPH|nr:cytidine deaminase [Martelella alba]TKI05799.1 cytidine deaminase [Martelella alba]